MQRTKSAFLAVLTVLLVPTVTTAGIINGGFETGDYTGWTLLETSGVPSFGTWGIASNGQTINPGDSVFDHYDGVDVVQNSPGLPRTYNTLDGSDFMAIQLQTGPEYHFGANQVMTLASDALTLEWDMFYDNHAGEFLVNDDPVNLTGQFLAIVLLDAAGINVLDTAFITNPGDPLSIGMTHFVHDISAFAGQTVMLAIQMDVDLFFFDAGFDNFQITEAPEPGTLALLGIGLFGLGLARRRKV